MLMILGSPRSGTSWLAKIFDSHPDVLYRHEPDEEVSGEALPSFCDPSGFERHRLIAQDYLNQLLKVHTIRTGGTLPIFRKSYHSARQHALRLVYIMAIRAAEKIDGAIATRARKMEIPDFVDFRAHPPRLVVAKSVNLLDRAGLFANTMPELRIILILRHPFGHIASQMRGIRMRKFTASEQSMHDLAAITERPPAKRRGLTATDFLNLSIPEQLAWIWLIYNEKAIEDIGRLSRAHILLYEDLLRAPEHVARKLYAFAGLPWSARTAQFIRSTQERHSNRYYSVYRAPEAQFESWRSILKSTETERILEIVKDSLPGQLFGDRLFPSDIPTPNDAGGC